MENTKLKMFCKTSQICSPVIDLSTWDEKNNITMRIRSKHYNFKCPHPHITQFESLEGSQIISRLETLAESNQQQKMDIRRESKGQRSYRKEDKDPDLGFTFKKGRAKGIQNKVKKIIEEYQSGSSKLTSISKACKTSLRFTKSVLRLFERTGDLYRPEYLDKNDLKEKVIGEVLDDFSTEYHSLEGLRRRVLSEGLTVSKRVISRVLKNRGKFYGKPIRLNPKNKRVLKKDQKFELCRVLRVIGESGHYNSNGIYFQDEMKLPLRQSSLKLWRNSKKITEESRHQTDLVLSCACIAGINGIRFLQIFQGELKSQDFEYFVVSSLHYLHKEENRLTIILDRAHGIGL